MTNKHKCSGLKHPPFISSELNSQKSRPSMDGISGSHGLNKVLASCTPTCSSGFPPSPCGCGRNQVLEDVMLESCLLADCQLRDMFSSYKLHILLATWLPNV